MNNQTCWTRGQPGFTLIELLVVIAILAILASIVLGIVLGSAGAVECNTKRKEAVAAVEDCKNELQASGPTVSTILNCLGTAQKTIQELKDGEWLGKKAKDVLRPLIGEVNQRIDQLKKSEDVTEAQETHLESAKLKIPTC